MNRQSHPNLTSEDQRNYPIFAGLLSDPSRQSSLRARCLQRCEKLGTLTNDNSVNEQDRDTARLTMQAIGHALDLLDAATSTETGGQR